MNNLQQEYDQNLFYNPDLETDDKDRDTAIDWVQSIIKDDLLSFGESRDHKVNLTDVFAYMLNNDTPRATEEAELNGYLLEILAKASPELRAHLIRNTDTVSENTAIETVDSRSEL